jgi:hypothetical protein
MRVTTRLYMAGNPIPLAPSAELDSAKNRDDIGAF